jgi:lipopolysaccharide/colanic/teichoic acid biosynthesis glycosyltransferase
MYKDAMSPAARSIKRLIDIIVSFFGMVLMSPFFIIIWCAIKIEDGTGGIFKQERMGYKGKTFTIYKFRSMIVTSEDNGVPQLCQEKDDRLTKVGRFLRDHHLDELPQLWNIFIGDMSLVGPRPERPYFAEKIMEQNPDYHTSILCTRVSSLLPHSTMATPIPWKKCSYVYVWIWNILPIVHYGAILKLYTLQLHPL